MDIDISCLKTDGPKPDPDWEPSEGNLIALFLPKVEQHRARVNETFLRLDPQRTA